MHPPCIAESVARPRSDRQRDKRPTSSPPRGTRRTRRSKRKGFPPCPPCPRGGEFGRPWSVCAPREIRASVHDAGITGFALQPSEVDGLIAFIRAGFDVSATVKLGHPQRGQALFDGRGGCATCHRVNGKGPRVAPDLSDIGAIRSPAALQRSLLDPTSAMLPINRPVRAVTRDGRTFRGRRLNEDTYTVQLIDEQERLVSLVKADLREYEVGTSSPMPSFAKTFDGDELADLVAYLLSLKGTQ